MSLSFALPPLTGGGFWVAFAQVALVYYGFAAAIHWAIPRLFEVESVQVGKRRPGQVKKEALLSIGPIAVKALVFTCVEVLARRQGLTKLYSGKIQGVKGWSYAVLTVAALDVLHDAWFYWTHRWMHQWKFLYRRVHSLHHESTVPTAFTGYAFHPIEGLIVFLNEILVTFLFPIHAGLHRSYHLWTTVIHNGGHAGYEIAPFIPSLAALATSLVEAASAVMGRASALPPGSGSRSEEAETETEKPPSRRRRAAAAHAAEETSKKARAALNTVRHHDMHHRFPFAHFSLYFTHWDSWLGTEHAGYRAAVEAHFSKKKEKEVEAEGESEVAAAGTEKNESVAAAASASAASDESSEKPSSTAAAASKAGLERLASAMEEYALLSQRKRDNQQQQQQRGGKGARSGSRSNNGESARSSDSSARRPRSPGIGAWRPATAAEDENEGIPQQRRWSGRLTRAA